MKSCGEELKLGNWIGGNEINWCDGIQEKMSQGTGMILFSSKR